MEFQIDDPDLPTIVIKSSPAELVKFLVLLRAEKGLIRGIPVSHANREKNSSSDSRTEKDPWVEPHPGKASKLAQPGLTTEPPHARRDGRGKQTDFGLKHSAKELAGIRPYRGKVNRRHNVLLVMKQLLKMGDESPDLETIRRSYGGQFPLEDQRNIDQVVRDMANKTDLLERHGRGQFRLTKSAMAGSG